MFPCQEGSWNTLESLGQLGQLERWAQKYGYATAISKLGTYFPRKMKKILFPAGYEKPVYVSGLPACEYCQLRLLTQQASLYWKIHPRPAHAIPPYW